jgi:4-amino-4-deoxychorismate lyase
MCRLLETIRVEKGVPLHLEYHQRRVDRSRIALFGTTDPLDLRTLEVPVTDASGIFKWRIVYGRGILETTIGPYLPKKIRSLQTVRNDRISYPFKYTDRNAINEMYDLKGECDDILIIKHGLITDTSYANIVFSDGRSWVTPRSPLLPGTCRERLLETGMAREEEITEKDLHRFHFASLINAMLEPGEIVIQTENIIPAP